MSVHIHYRLTLAAPVWHTAEAVTVDIHSRHDSSTALPKQGHRIAALRAELGMHRGCFCCLSLHTQSWPESPDASCHHFQPGQLWASRWQCHGC